MKATEALVELKLLTKRINSGISGLQAISYTNGGVLASPEKDKEKFKVNAKSGMDSVTALIERRAAIKSALVLSNATVKISINGKEMTVASAIERKSSIESERDYLTALVTQYNGDTRKVEALTQQVQREVDEQIKAMGAIGADLVASTRASILEQRKVELFDPHGLLEVIEKLRKEIDTFEAEVDVKLSISNATTEIVVA